MWQSIVTYFQENTAVYLAAVGTHLWVSLLSLLLAVTLAVPLGIAAAKRPAWYRGITTVFNTLRIIPSLAVLIFLIPLLGTGILPAVVALTLLGIPPILLNTAVAFHLLPAFMTETAVAMGMSGRQRFFRVQLPLAFPRILTGIKTALVEIIASATLAAYIGGGGVGDIIFTGLGLNRMDLLVIGGLTVALLSLTANILLSLWEKHLGRYRQNI